ncbi:hypothetical protein MMC30_003602 [Trapelia coarctata]|nr:hypothetical protein [Trapelia coarctata]
MASLGESAYFPPLDQCLDGDFQLMSWKNTFIGISQLPSGAGHNTLKRHLSDTRTAEIITHFLSPFSPPTPQAKAAFETQTSAIHITPNSSGRYKLSEIKEDALWLSKEVGIDEISALRTVIIEWQTRPAVWLLRGFADDDGSATRPGVESNNLLSSLLGSQYGAIGSEVAASFDSCHERRMRLLDVYLSERQFLAKTAEFITFNALFMPAETEAIYDDNRNEDAKDKTVWLEEVGAALLKSWNPRGIDSNSGNNWLVDATAALGARLENLARGSGWLQDEDTAVDVEVAWCRVQLMEMIHIMQTMISLVMSSGELTRADVLRSWFKFVGHYGFFEQFELPFQELSAIYKLPFQSLIALLSLALLGVPLARATLQRLAKSTGGSSTADPSIATPNPSDDAPYLLNEAVIEQVNDVLVGAAAASSCNASLAMLAWAVILQDLREYADASKEVRELSQSERAADSFGVSREAIDDRNESPPAQRRPSPHRRSSFGSDSSQQITYLEEVLEMIKRTPVNDDPIMLLARTAIDHSNVFEVIASLAISFCTPFGSEQSGKPGKRMRLLLLDLIRAALDWVDYGPEVVEATLAVLQGSQTYWDTMQGPPDPGDADPIAVFLDDAFLRNKIFEAALTRFPYEFIPFLRLCGTLATTRSVDQGPNMSIVPLLSNMKSFTCTLYENAASYRVEESEATYVELTSELDMFIDWRMAVQQKSITSAPRDLILNRISGQSRRFKLPEGTLGRDLGSTKPLVVMWRYEYSAFQYIGRALQHAMTGNGLQPGLGPGSTRETTSEIISCLTTILASVRYGEIHSWQLSEARDMARFVLEDTSDGLDGNEDAISLVLAIFEAELHRSHSSSWEEESNQLLVQCIQFTHALLSVIPGRVWPFLGRSGLLGLDGNESRLAAVVATSELTSGTYDFLLGCIRLYDALIEDALTNVVSRKQTHQVSARFDASGSDVLGTGITDALMKKILHGFLRLLVDAFQSCRSWKFVSLLQRLEINTEICSLFDKILCVCFKIDDNLDISRKLVSFLAPAAECLIDVFLSTTANELPIQPLLQIFLDGLATPSSTLSKKGSESWMLQTESAMKLITTLVRVNNYLGLNTRIEEQLFTASPILARLYAAHDRYQSPVVDLLEVLIVSAGSSTKQVPSILGQMGQGIAKRFIDMLATLDQPLDDRHQFISIWKLLSAVVSQRQQWFAIYILTGSTPRESLKSKDDANSSTTHHMRSMLSIAMNRLCDANRLDTEEAISMLEFISKAADYWPWVMAEILKNSKFTNKLLNSLDNLESSPSGNSSKAADPDIYQIQMASLIIDICSIAVRHCSQTGDNLFSKEILSHLTYLMQYGVAVPSYNVSLHSNLSKNFEAKFPGCRLSHFKRTSFSRPSLGKGFYYDIELTGKMLSYDSSWAGKGDRGFAEEFARANVNLSLVEAQVNLFHSWKTLMIQISFSLNENLDFQKSTTAVIKGCLQSNINSTLPEAIFQKLSQSRADLAFALMQRLIEVAPQSVEAQSLLNPAWEIVRSHSPDIGLALVDQEADYTRTLLKILCLALQPQTLVPAAPTAGASASTNSMSSSETSQVVQGILGMVVAHGFRSLTTLLLDDASKALPGDFALIIAILRASLQVPGVEQNAEQLVAKFAEVNTMRYACTLLSWSDRLMIDNDPIYGELSMTLLTQLSTVPQLAESIAVDGILTQISSANLMQFFLRPGGTGPFSPPVAMYNIWTRSMLQLALSLLGAVGAPVAADVGTFINQFHPQLARASSSFDIKPTSAPSETGAFYITFGMATEAHSLAFIVKVLDQYREAGPSAGIVASDIVDLAWDRNQVKEDLESWVQRRNALRESIAATNEKEEAWARQKPVNAQSGAENRLEEKLMDEILAALALLGDG